ncbi:10719_t:CDS:2 [Rhizophagus irregularis]|nr:10719_t:CDS:2 [Rhizophagus irregularis]
MNYEESREQDVNMLALPRPTDKDFSSATIAIVAQPDGSSHQEVPVSPVPSHDSSFTVSPNAFRDGSFVSTDVGATSSGVVLTVVQKFKGDTDIKQLDNDAAKLWIWELARKATQIAVDQQDNTLEELLKSYIKEKEERTRTNSQNAQQ